jgi:hypothetical protein
MCQQMLTGKGNADLHGRVMLADIAHLLYTMGQAPKCHLIDVLAGAQLK